MKFTTTVLAAGKTATGIPVPESVVTALAAGKRPAVQVTVGGHRYRSTIAPYGGGWSLPLSAENRAAAKVSAGDEVEVEVVLDSEPREAEVPADFAAAMDAEPTVRAFFDSLSFSNQRSYLLWVEGTKNPGTRARRVVQGVELLRGGQSIVEALVTRAGQGVRAAKGTAFSRCHRPGLRPNLDSIADSRRTP